MKDGIIELDSEFAKEIGFTSDKFDGWLWKRHGYIIISFLISKQKRHGNFSKLLNTILNNGFGIKVPTPSNTMKNILYKKGFKEIEECDERRYAVEVWVKPNEASIHAANANIAKRGGQHMDKTRSSPRMYPKHSLIYIPIPIPIPQRPGCGEWHRFKLAEVMNDYELLGHVIHGKKDKDWRWA